MLCPAVYLLGVSKPGKLGNRTSTNGKHYVEESETDRTEQRPCQQVIGLLWSHAHIQLWTKAEAAACCSPAAAQHSISVDSVLDSALNCSGVPKPLACSGAASVGEGLHGCGEVSGRCHESLS